MKKTISIALLLLTALGARTQNIQEMYDFGRGHLTTTLEMYKGDKWGGTFWFVDIYHNNHASWPTDYYTEFSRSINLWQNTRLAPLSLHVEWNGGVGYPVGYDKTLRSYYTYQYPVCNTWLLGVEYFMHNSDFSKTLTLQVLYRTKRPFRVGGAVGTNVVSNVPMQLTAVWELKDIFGVKGLAFSGFADFWWENRNWDNPALATDPTAPLYLTTATTFTTEPQLWYNVGQLFGCENLMVGGEVELNHDFFDRGWKAYPCAGIKWVF